MKPFWGMVLGLGLGTGLGWILAALVQRRKNHLRERLFSFIAHELGTPLTGVTLCVKNFLGGVFGEVPEGFRPWFEMMRDQVDLAGLMVSDLGDLFHLEFGRRRLKMRKKALAVPGILSEAAGKVSALAKRSGVNLNLEVPESLPEVFGDGDRLARVLRNLMGYALKFSSGGEVRVEAHHEDSGAAPRNSVSDSDPAPAQVPRPPPEAEDEWSRRAASRAALAAGVVVVAVEYFAIKGHSEEPDRLLGRYYVAEQTTQVLRSVGVGMAVCRDIAEQHGGRLVMERDLAGKSRFLLTLPVADEACTLRRAPSTSDL